VRECSRRKFYETNGVMRYVTTGEKEEKNGDWRGDNSFNCTHTVDNG
jgi:hypothetical protein